MFESSRNEHPSIAEDRQRLSRARRRQGTGRWLEAAFRGIVNLKRGDGLAADFTASNQRLPVIQKDDRSAGLTWGETLRNRPPFSKYFAAARGPVAFFPPVTSDRPSFNGVEQAPSRPPVAAVCKPVRSAV